MHLDAIIIAKNEERNIRECIESLSFCKKVIVIDNGSYDSTAKIALQQGAEVISQKGSFSELRNKGLMKVTSEWVIYIDADERVSKDLENELKRMQYQENSEITAYFLRRKNYYYGKNPWPYIEKLERVFKKDSLVGWHGVLHETPEVKGKIGELDGYLYHYSHQDLASMVEKTNEWSDIEAKLRYDARHPRMTGWRFFRVMMTAFFDSYIKQGGYRAGTVGIIESIYQAFSMFITYAKLWEMQNRKKV